MYYRGHIFKKSYGKTKDDTQLQHFKECWHLNANPPSVKKAVLSHTTGVLELVFERFVSFFYFLCLHSVSIFLKDYCFCRSEI